MIQRKLRYWSVCDFFLYTRSFTDPSSRQTRRVSKNGISLSSFFVGELDVASGINAVNMVRKVPLNHKLAVTRTNAIGEMLQHCDGRG